MMVIFAVAQLLLAVMVVGLWQQQVALDEIARKEEEMGVTYERIRL